MGLIIALYYLLWIINTLLFFQNKKCKAVSLISMLFMFVLFATNLGLAGDALKYKLDYEANYFGDNWTEAGYELLKNISRFLGLHSYNSFLVLIFIICSLLIWRGMKKLNGNFHMIYAVSMCFIFPALATAVRFFIAFSIFIYSLHFLYENKAFCYWLGILIAFSFHRTALIFFLLPVCVYISKHSSPTQKIINKISYRILISIVLFVVIYIYLTSRLPFIELLIRIVGKFSEVMSYRLEYYTSTIARYGAIIFFAVYFANLISAVYLRKKTNIIQNEMQKKLNKLNLLSESNYYCNILFIVILPFLNMNLVFFRLLLVPTIMNVILLSNMLVIKQSKFQKAKGLFCLIIISWIVPEVIGINSITISGLVRNSIFALIV